MPRVPRQGEPVSARHISQVVRTAEAARIGSAPGTLTASGPLGSTIKAAPRPVLRAPTVTTRFPWQIFGPYLDGTDWLIGIYPGTVSGLTPVVGDVESTGGSTLTRASRLTLVSGEDYVCLGIKTDLETREILRLTVQTREDLAPIVNTSARTRICFAPLAQLTEVVTPTTSWSLLHQIGSTHLRYLTVGNADILTRI